MSFHEGSKWQEQMEDAKKFGVTKVKQTQQKRAYSEEEQIQSYINVWSKANQKSLKDFINWCIEQDYYFEKPII